MPTIKAILDSPDLRLDGFLGPGHVSMVIGTAPYQFIARYYRKSMVVSGFEPLDILQSIWMLLKQIKDGRIEIENHYARVVPEGGNAPALKAGRAIAAHLLKALRMHELAITQNIVGIVAEAAQGRRVMRVTLGVGKLCGVMADAIAFCFDIVARDTGLEGATLAIHEIDGRARCEACGFEFEAETLFTPCRCGSRRSTRIRGEELIVKSIEMMEAA